MTVPLVPPVPDPARHDRPGRQMRWRVDVVDYQSGSPARFHLRWSDLTHRTDPRDWEGPTIPAAVAWATERGLPDPEQAMLDAAVDAQR